MRNKEFVKKLGHIGCQKQIQDTAKNIVTILKIFGRINLAVSKYLILLYV